MPAVAALCGLLADAVGSRGAVRATRTRWLYVILVPLLLDRAWVLAQQSPALLWQSWPASAWTVAYIALLLALVAWSLARTGRRAATLIVALIYVACAV